MKFIVLIPLVIYQHFSVDKAAVCTIIYALAVGAWSYYLGNVVPYVAGQVIGTLIFGGLYFGILGKLDDEGWAYWVVMIAGGLVLGLAW